MPFNDKARRYPAYSGLAWTCPACDDLLGRLDALASDCDREFAEFRFYAGIQLVMAAVRQCNGLVQDYKPWQLAKSPDGQADLERMMFVVNETLRISGILLQAVVPGLAKDLLDRLGVEPERRLFEDARVRRDGAGHDLTGLKAGLLFRKSKPLTNNKTHKN